jgi:hypothetical protein
MTISRGRRRALSLPVAEVNDARPGWPVTTPTEIGVGVNLAYVLLGVPLVRWVLSPSRGVRGESVVATPEPASVVARESEAAARKRESILERYGPTPDGWWECNFCGGRFASYGERINHRCRRPWHSWP